MGVADSFLRDADITSDIGSRHILLALGVFGNHVETIRPESDSIAVVMANLNF
jgi:hypothetical protein